MQSSTTDRATINGFACGKMYILLYCYGVAFAIQMYMHPDIRSQEAGEEGLGMRREVAGFRSKE